MSDEKTTSRYRFGSYELDVEKGELRRSGVPVRLQAKPLRLLGLLVARADETVDRETIRRHVWPADVHVEFDQGINACIKQIRAALGDSADEPHIIETVPRGGYRFLLPVEPVPAVQPGPLTSALPGASSATLLAPTSAPRSRRFWARPAAVAAACALSLVLLAMMRAGGHRGLRTGQQPVLAVLPFSLLADGKEDVFFRDALTDELITQLGRRYGARMGVIARTSIRKYANQDVDIAAIGRELGADYILEGSVRHLGDHLRINAQLVRVADGSHMWGSAFQRESDDLLKLQVELGETIAEGLALQIVPGVTGMAGSTRPEVYEGYLRGRQAMNQGRLKVARRELEQAVSLDPGFAQAWSALAATYQRLGPEPGAGKLARQALARALALDDQIPEAHFTLAMERFYRDYDFEGARKEFQRAIELNPAFADAHEAFAGYYAVLGRHDEAIAEIQQARRLDPLSSMTNSDVGWYYYFARRYDEAILYSERTLVLDPDFFWANQCIQLCYLQRGDWQSAVAHARREMERRGASPAVLASLSSPDRDTALGAYWRWALAGLEARRRKEPTDSSSFAQAYMALGQPEQAIAELEASFETRSGWILPFLAVDPAFEPLKADARFQDLVARVRSGEARIGTVSGERPSTRGQAPG